MEQYQPRPSPVLPWPAGHAAPGAPRPGTDGRPLVGETLAHPGSAQVRWVQSALNQVLGVRLAVDGVAGPATRSAVRSFQQQAGLTVDGIAGPQTVRALVAAGAPPPPSAGPAPSGARLPIPTPANAQGLRQQIVALANQEWQRWGRGSAVEGDPRMQPVLRDYWERGVGLTYPGPDTAWSAAFISWVLRQAGAGNAFLYSASHTRYVAAAKRNRLANNHNPFKAYRVGEISPQVGDIVCAERLGAGGRPSGVTFDNVDDGQFRASHCDIVTAVNGNAVTVIGGNVRNSVTRRPIYTGALGQLSQPPYFAIIRIG